MANDDEYYIAFSGELTIAEGKKIFPSRMAKFHERLGEVVAQVARECFEDDRVAEVTIDAMPVRTLCRTRGGRSIAAATYTIPEWLCEVEEVEVE